MFERFTERARTAVVDAQQWARDAMAAEIGAEHLLLALRGNTITPVGTYLDERLPSAGDLVAEFDRMHRRGGMSDRDADALAELGIDLGAVVDAVEREHGAGALAVVPRRKRRHLPFTAEAKTVLESTLREAVDLGSRVIGEEHLLLALLSVHSSAADLLAVHEIRYLAVRADLAVARAS